MTHTAMTNRRFEADALESGVLGLHRLLEAQAA
jgi:hypothetical protein